MSVFDMITLAIIGIFLIIGIWKGFLKLLLRFGAWILAAIIAKSFGGSLGKLLWQNWIQSESLSADVLNIINFTIASVLGTTILFIISFIILRFLVNLIGKAVKNTLHIGLLDRILGALAGLLAGCAVVCLLAIVINILTLIASLVNSDTMIFYEIEDTVIFKYFFGLL